jgi:C-terminal processing protease CtpA/Prc
MLPTPDLAFPNRSLRAGHLLVWCFVALGLLLACGGGGSSQGTSGSQPSGSQPTPDPSAKEKAFILKTVREHYLFPEDLPAQVDLGQVATPQNLLEVLTRKAVDAGRDRWSRLVGRAASKESEGQDLEDAGNGVEPEQGFGFFHEVIGKKVIVTEVLPGSGASRAGLRRGDEILAFTRASLGNLDQIQDLLQKSPNPAAVLAAVGAKGWGATASGGSVGYFRIQSAVTGRRVDCTVTQTPIPSYAGIHSAHLDLGGGRKVGYLRFREFRIAEAPRLRVAFAHFKHEGVRDLVLDLRYNSGGDSAIRELLLNLLRDHPAPGDIVVQQLGPGGKVQKTVGFQAQPESIGLHKIAIIVSGDSASASEATVKALEPYCHQNLALVGARTGGKPVGQTVFPVPGSQWDLWLTTFRVVNKEGRGDWYGGLPDPGFQGVTAACADDLAHLPGDRQEACTQAALEWIAHGTVPHGPIP